MNLDFYFTFKIPTRIFHKHFAPFSSVLLDMFILTGFEKQTTEGHQTGTTEWDYFPSEHFDQQNYYN